MMKKWMYKYRSRDEQENKKNKVRTKEVKYPKDKFREDER